VRHTAAFVDLAALSGNVRAIRSLLETGEREAGRAAPRLIGVVKANAYGHGAVAVARALEAAGIWMLACADVDEGIALREAGIRAPILVFGALGVSDLSGVFAHDLTPTVSSPWAARALAAAAADRQVVLDCHVKIDTGMNRLGFRYDNLRRTLPEVLAAPSLRVTGVYTHFATADDPESAAFGLQQAHFATARRQLAALGLGTVLWHSANSAALLRDERTWGDAVRPGLLLYGVVPPPLMTTLPLEPVLSLRSCVVSVKGVRAGEGLGYGLTAAADHPRTVAIVPAGYADGLDWRLGNRGVALVRGRRVPIVGRVSMDSLTVDVTDLDVSPGDEVVLIGRQGDERIDVREVAATIGSIPWELLCRLGARIERRVIGEASSVEHQASSIKH
jgi:alanine racemase